jgi:hypothetical protein
VIAGHQRLDAAVGGPVGLVYLVAVAQVAGDEPEVATVGESGRGVLRRVPGERIAHEVREPGALRVGTLREHGVRDVARVQVVQALHVVRREGAPLALVRERCAVVPHVEVGDEHPPALEHVHERGVAARPAHRDARHRRHRQPTYRGRDRVSFAGVRLLPGQQLVALAEPGLSVDDRRHGALGGGGGHGVSPSWKLVGHT